MSASIELGWLNGKLQAGAAGAAAIVEKASRQMKGSLSGITSGLGDAIGVTPFLSIAGAVAGATVGAKMLADELDHVWDVSQRLNESPESIQRIGLQAQLSGSDLDGVVRSLQKLNLELAKGSAGEGTTALKKLGIDAAEFIRLSPEQQLYALAIAFQDARKAGTGFVELKNLLGKNFSELLPLLRTSREELEKIAATEVVKSETIEALASMRDNFERWISGMKANVVNTTADSVSHLTFAHRALWAALTGTTDKLAAEIAAEKTAIVVAEGLSDAEKQAERDNAALTAQYDECAERANEFAKAQSDADKETRKTIETTNRATDALAKYHAEQKNAERGRIEVQLSPREKQGYAEAELGIINQQIAAIKGRQGNEEIMVQLQTARLRKETEILQIKNEIEAEDLRIIEAEAEKKKKADEVAAKYATNLEMLDLELAILNAQASGHDKKAKQLEHERDVQEETARIVADTGLAYADAAKKAEQLVSAKERLDGRKDGNGRRKIRGYSQEQDSAGDTIGAGFKRAEMRRSDARAKAENGVMQYMGMEGMSASRLTPRADIGARTPATDAPRASGESEIAAVIKGYTEQTIEIFKQALA